MSIYIETESDENDENKNRTYIVTAKFKISGFLPDRVTDEHILSNIKSDLEHAMSEVAFSSEYYDGDDQDEEWGMYIEDDAKIELQRIAVRIRENPFCEHCGERYTDFGVEIFDGGTSWCLDCFLSGDGSEILTKEDIEEIRKQSKKLRQKYLLKELHKLENDDEE